MFSLFTIAASQFNVDCILLTLILVFSIVLMSHTCLCLTLVVFFRHLRFVLSAEIFHRIITQ